MTQQEIGEIVLRFDEMLCGDGGRVLDEQYRRLAAERVGFADQLEAAKREALEAMTRLAERAGDSSFLLGFRELPEWVRLGLLTALVSWVFGEASTCAHRPDPMRPQPVVAAAWKPDLVVCGECTDLFVLPPGSDADRTCDGCGRVVEEIVPWAVSHGAFTYLMGLCDGCTLQ